MEIININKAALHLADTAKELGNVVNEEDITVILA